MKISITRSLAMLCLGLAVATPLQLSLADGAAAATQASQTAQARLGQDVQLFETDGLVGQTLNAAGAPEAGIKVALLHKDQPIANVVSGRDGYFVIRNVRPGVYTVVADENRTVVRTWSSEIAPPSAGEIAVVSTNPAIVRGQGPSWTVCAVTAAVAIAGGTALAIALSNRGNDEGRLPNAS